MSSIVLPDSLSSLFSQFHKIEQIVQELKTIPGVADTLVNLMNQGQYLEECYQLLKRLNETNIAIPLENLLDSPQQIVQRYAILTLADTPDIPKSNKLKQKLCQWLSEIPHPPTNETDCIDMLKAITRLIKMGEIKEDMPDRLQSILYFIPRGNYAEAYWPKAWIETSRILYKLGYIDKLREVACSQNTNYLSTAGAIALATNGFREGSVDEWLKNSRDYYLLTPNECFELEQILLELDNTYIQLAQLAGLRKKREKK